MPVGHSDSGSVEKTPRLENGLADFKSANGLWVLNPGRNRWRKRQKSDRPISHEVTSIVPPLCGLRKLCFISAAVL
jgi:hypothetical protein